MSRAIDASRGAKRRSRNRRQAAYLCTHLRIQYWLESRSQSLLDSETLIQQAGRRHARARPVNRRERGAPCQAVSNAFDNLRKRLFADEAQAMRVGRVRSTPVT